MFYGGTPPPPPPQVNDKLGLAQENLVHFAFAQSCQSHCCPSCRSLIVEKGHTRNFTSGDWLAGCA